MTSTFFGLEEPLQLPPNVHLTGPNINPSSADNMAILKEKDPRIFEWLEDAKEKGEKVVYISIGSEAYWTVWAIEAVKKGIERLTKECKARCIWGFPKLGKGEGPQCQHPFGKDDDKVIVQAWLPQVEIIAHPTIACGLTHCGFGGTTEYIMAGIPMLCHPFFGDQPMNA